MAEQHIPLKAAAVRPFVKVSQRVGQQLWATAWNQRIFDICNALLNRGSE